MCISFFNSPGRINSVGRGSPNSHMMIDNRVTRITPNVLSSTSEAVKLYRDAGGSISDHCEFGVESLNGNAEKV